MLQSELDFIKNLRQASPYVEKHRGKTFVIYCPSELLTLGEPSNSALFQFAKDVIFLNTLGIKTVITLGAEQQINEALAQENLNWSTHLNCRVTEQIHLKSFKQTIGLVRAKIEAAFTQACAEQASLLNIVSGNWVIAKPKGVIEGVDYQHTGSLRKVNHQAISEVLNTGNVVLLTPLTYSLTGEIFNLNTLEQAFSVAQSLKANKLLIFTSNEVLTTLPKQMNISSVGTELQHSKNSLQKRLLELTLSTQKKINRIHFIDQSQPSTMILELFSRDGVGSLIFMDRYHQIRAANIEDVANILNLISSLENKGILVKRSRECLELEIENFYVITRDEDIIGCGALYPINENYAEIACIAITPEYQGRSLGEELLFYIEKQAIAKKITRLFLLTTQTHHWFIEHDFKLVSLDQLPAKKQPLYNHQRQSKVLVKDLKSLCF